MKLHAAIEDGMVPPATVLIDSLGRRVLVTKDGDHSLLQGNVVDLRTGAIRHWSHGVSQGAVRAEYTNGQVLHFDHSYGEET